ncbi:MAG TPA: hypothetical protein VLH38_04835 [Patescibacteria group bacterium]|nr:hypothetical protein [Patescibacteria group bacterium]
MGTSAALLTIVGVYKASVVFIPGAPFPFFHPAYIAVIGASLLVALLASVLPTIGQVRKDLVRTE